MIIPESLRGLLRPSFAEREPGAASPPSRAARHADRDRQIAVAYWTSAVTPSQLAKTYGCTVADVYLATATRWTFGAFQEVGPGTGRSKQRRRR